MKTCYLAIASYTPETHYYFFTGPMLISKDKMKQRLLDLKESDIKLFEDPNKAKEHCAEMAEKKIENTYDCYKVNLYKVNVNETDIEYDSNMSCFNLKPNTKNNLKLIEVLTSFGDKDTTFNYENEERNIDASQQSSCPIL